MRRGAAADGSPIRRVSRRQGINRATQAPPTRAATTAAGDQPVTRRLLANEPDRANEAAETNAIGRPVRTSTVGSTAVVLEGAVALVTVDPVIGETCIH